MFSQSRVSTSAFLVFILLSIWGFNALASEHLEVQRLTWAGVKLTKGDTSVFVDTMATDIWNGEAPEGFVMPEASTGRRYALITHTHNDHFDEAGLKQLLGPRGYVICHQSIAAHIASRGLRVIPASTWEPVARGGFLFTAVPASDGFGAEQVSWVIKADNKTLFHGGDTLWHGQFDLIGQQFGPIDAAFMPINGPRLQSEPAVHTPAVLTPTQALDAAALLRAEILVPIHFGFNDPPHYVEYEKPLESLTQEAAQRKQSIRHLLPGEFLLQSPTD